MIIALTGFIRDLVPLAWIIVAALVAATVTDAFDAVEE